MKLRWPLVWRVQVDFLERIISNQDDVIRQLQRERGEQQERADRAVDQLSVLQGGEYISEKNRLEFRQQADSLKKEQNDFMEAMRKVDSDLASEFSLDAQIKREEQAVQ